MELNSKLLSISIAAYNVEKYLEKCVNSCCIVGDEYYNRVEIIIVNDGSKDNTLAIAKELQSKHPEIIRIIDKQNGGYGSTINASIEIASGKYYRLLDGDDWVDERDFALLLRELERHDEDLIMTDFCQCYVDDEKIVGSKRKCVDELEKNHPYLKTDLKDIYVAMHSICVKTECLKHVYFPILEHCFYTDHEFVFSVLSGISTVYYLDLCVYQYRLGRDGQSVNYKGILAHLGDNWRVMNAELDYLKNAELDENTKEIITSYLAILGKDVIHHHLLPEYSKARKEKLIEIDTSIKQRNIDVYFRIQEISASIKLLRKCGYRFYRLFRLNEIRKFK